jgi:hypothetical protein
MNKSGSSTVGLCGHFVTINSYDLDSLQIVNLLCRDLHHEKTTCSCATYDLMAVGKSPLFSLWQDNKQLYFGTSRYDLAYTLVNEIIFHCINNNTDGHAIHAAALGSNRCGGVLLPGKSGSGKSTLTARLVSSGSNYLTDELVLLTGKDNRIHPFTRPISIKAGSAAVLSTFLMYDQHNVIAGTNGCMLPHRLLNAHHPAVPTVSLILFPRYSFGAATRLQSLSPAQACAGLLECFVNARNLPGHGIREMAKLTRSIPACRLTYSNFTGLNELLAQSFPHLFS